MRYLTIALAAFVLAPVPAQSRLTENTLAVDAPDKAATATLADVAWLAGRWRGQGLGGEVEETWNPALGGTMVGTFRLVRDGKPGFYELLVLEPAGTSISYKVKHFHPDLRGWETQEGYVTFPLVRIGPDEACFRGLTIRREGDTCTHYLALKQKDGSYREEVMRYRRADAAAPAPTAKTPVTDGTAALGKLAPLLGAWGPETHEDRVVHDYSWTVGKQALRLREGFAAGKPETAQLDGLVFHDPASGTIRFTAVAGHGAGQGRVFEGVYTALDDGRIERTYEVRYRKLADVPGEQLGGMTRRFREVYTIGDGRLAATLEWWHDDRWQPFGMGKYALERRRPDGR